MNDCKNDGKLSLDMLIGLSIFLFTFIFIAQFLPTVFADVRSEISLANQAYRVATLLVEDPGVWYNVTGGGEDWEKYSVYDLCNKIEFRPGLAKFNSTTAYNNLDKGKMEKLIDVLEQCRGKVGESLGLNFSSIGVNTTFYFNISLRDFNSSVCEINGSSMAGGYILPQYAQKVKFERIVYMNKAECSALSNCNPTWLADRCILRLEVVVWQ